MQSHSDRNSSVRLGQTSGPLYSYIPGFTASLTSRGYCKASIAYRLTLLRDLDQWMRQRRMAIEEFSEDPIRRFLRYRRKHDSKRRGDKRYFAIFAETFAGGHGPDESPRSAAGQLRTTPEGATGPQAGNAGTVPISHPAVSF